jgi:hypothetical protein
VGAFDTSRVKSIRHADQAPVAGSAALGLENLNLVMGKIPMRIFGGHNINSLEDKFINQYRPVSVRIIAADVGGFKEQSIFF